MPVTLAERLPRTDSAPPVMEKFVIEGGTPLSGTIVPAGNKNGALPILAASVLSSEEVVIRNVPRIRDVEAMLAVLEGLGVTMRMAAATTRSACAPRTSTRTRRSTAAAPRRSAHRSYSPDRCSRASAARRCRRPGGDVIGRRRLDPHLDGFAALGASFRHERDIVIDAPVGGLRAAEVFMDEPSVMATENVLMAAALTPGETVIGNAACEPHVQDLARMLVKMGADIRGIGSNVLTITGAARARRLQARHRPGPHRDRVVHGARRRHRRRAADQRHRPRRPADDPPGLPKLGLQSEIDGADVIVRGGQKLVAARDVGEYKAKVQDGPVAGVPGRPHVDRGRARHPGRGLGPDPRVDVREPDDLHRQARADGRQHHACATRTAPSSAVRSRLRGERVESPDIRAGMAMLIAALCADGRSEIGNIRQIDRGYERIDERLRARSAGGSSGSRPTPSPFTRIPCAIPSGTRDVLPDEMRELRAITERDARDLRRLRLRRDLDAGGRVRGDAARGGPRTEAVLPRLRRPRRVLALRADMTVPIARVVATRYADAEPPLRFCYVAHAYRGVRPHRGQMREFLQAGDRARRRARPGGHGEALTVLCEALESTGCASYRIGVGDATLYPTLLDAFDVPAAARDELLHELAMRDFVGLDREVASLGLSAEAAATLSRVPRCAATPACWTRSPARFAMPRRAAHRHRSARPGRRRPGRHRPRPLPAACATTPARCSRSTTPSSASRSAAAGATTSCSAASAGRCPPSASRSTSTGCTPRSPARNAGRRAGEPLRRSPSPCPAAR